MARYCCVYSFKLDGEDTVRLNAGYETYKKASESVEKIGHFDRSKPSNRTLVWVGREADLINLLREQKEGTE